MLCAESLRFVILEKVVDGHRKDAAYEQCDQLQAFFGNEGMRLDSFPVIIIRFRWRRVPFLARQRILV
jgi:hypothetical protein